LLAVAAEYQLTRVGLGFAIFNAQQLLDVDRLYAALVAVSLLGLALSGILTGSKRSSCPGAAPANVSPAGPDCIDIGPGGRRQGAPSSPPLARRRRSRGRP